jgi:hypothetical protein
MVKLSKLTALANHHSSALSVSFKTNVRSVLQKFCYPDASAAGLPHFTEKEMVMSTHLSGQCACPECTCEVNEHQRYERNGETFCSDACADLHPHGKPCPSDSCQCESGVRIDERHVTESNIDEALDETFPASDPISP